MNRTNELAEENTGKLLIKYFIPAFVGVIANSLYNIVDRIYIGQGVGAYALSGLSSVFPIMIIIIAFGMLIGIGTSVNISISLGKKDKLLAEKFLGNGFAMMLIIALVVTVIGFLVKKPLLILFGTSPETMQYADDYLSIILYGVVFQIIGYSMNGIIRAEGNARIAMLTMIIGAGINIILDPIFIFVFGWGVKGAAWATNISFFVVFIWVVSHFRSKRSVLFLHIPNIKIDWPIILKIVAIGVSPFLMQMAASIIHTVYNIQLTKYGGDLAIGAMGIVFSISIIIIMSIVAINMAMQPIIGYNFGAQRLDRVKQTLKQAIYFATFISVSGFLIIQLFPGFIVKIFNSDNVELYEIGRMGIRISLLMLPVIGFQIVTSNYFQAIGNAKVTMFLSLLRQVIILLPLLFILPNYFGLNGIFYSTPIADGISAIVTAFFLYRERKRLAGV